MGGLILEWKNTAVEIEQNWFLFKLNKCINCEAHIQYFDQRVKKLSSKVFVCSSYFFAIYEYTVLTEYQCIRQGIPGKVYVKDDLIQITNDLIIKFVSM